MIIVLGPGRCGSSTIARLLHNELGVSMGNRFRAPNKSNPQGFYEDLDFRDLNQNAVRNLFTSDHFQKEIDQLVKNRTELWGIKDPMICHLWPEYRRFKSQYIVCTRKPQLIVRSLMVNYNWTERESKNVLITRLDGIDRLLEGRDALRIDFTEKREDTELTNLLQNFLRLP